jgi:exosortase
MAADLSAPIARRPSAVQPPPASSSPNPLLWASLALVVAAFIPLGLEHGRRLWDRPHYQFFPFVFIGSAALAWSRWPTGTLTPGDASNAMIGLVSGLVLLFGAEIVYSPSLSVVGALVFLMSGVYRMGGWPLCKAMLPAWLFLWILIPLPFGLDRSMVMGMQTLTSNISSYILDYFGVIHVLSGNVIEISGHRMLVEEACAGVNSLFSILACGLFVILFLRRPWFRSIVLIMSSLGWVLVSNVIRVVSIAIAQNNFNSNWSDEPAHTFLGLGCFVFAVLMILSTDRLLLFFAPRQVDRPIVPDASGAQPAIPTVGFCPLPLAAVFLVPLAFHFVVHGIFAQGEYGPREVLPTIAKLDSETLPKTIKGWTRIGFDEKTRTMASAFGEYSKIWHFKRDNLIATIQVDYPFEEFHGLWECYLGQGWDMAYRNTKDNKDNPTLPEHWYEVQFSKPGLHFGYLIFTELNPNNEALPFEGRFKQTFHRYERIMNRWREWTTKSNPTPERLRGPAYQVQIFVDSTAMMTEQENAAVHDLYFSALETLRKEIFPAKK